MDPALREDFAVIGTTAAALVIGVLAVAGGITLGFAVTMQLELLLATTYLAVWCMLRLTTRALRRPVPAPAPAPAPAPEPDDTDTDGD